ncbi:hypothetical protein NDU88_002983 [Pleurodeles waltl]|uniref:Uncharacterized protein n=1 Tax=Pleurodeles waltl TaxID=8319 RepID=A0AAV7MPJ0_PLEWA|nr:hypothetical protein NDU88_002983 [Pleurodeles waltl]
MSPGAINKRRRGHEAGTRSRLPDGDPCCSPKRVAGPPRPRRKPKLTTVLRAVRDEVCDADEVSLLSPGFCADGSVSPSAVLADADPIPGPADTVSSDVTPEVLSHRSESTRYNLRSNP